MSKILIRQLKTLRHKEVKPNEAWLKNNRELLLSQIRNTVSIQPARKMTFDNFVEFFAIFLPQSFVHRVVRPMVAFILVLAMGVGSWVATVSASYQALPGDFLYSAKRATETIQVRGAEAVGNTNNAAKLHLEFAKRRADETKTIVSQNNPEKINLAAQTVDDLKNEIQNINSKLEEIKTSDDSAGELVKDINKNTQEINGVLKEVKVNLLISTDKENSADLATQVSEVKSIVKDTAVKAVEVMVVKHLQGDESVSKDDVKEAIAIQLQSAAKDVVESKDSITEVNKAINVVKTEVTNAIAKETKYTSLTTTAENAQLSEKIEATSKQTQEAVTNFQKVSTETDKTVIEGKELLSQDNLSSAIDKIKTVNAATAEVEKITDATLKAVQEILPVVSAVADVVNIPSSTSVAVTTTPNSSTFGIVLSQSSTIKFVTTTTSTVSLKTTTTPAAKP
jgi:hypothetical protein